MDLMAFFEYDTSAGYTLQVLGIMHDDWLNRVWKQYKSSNLDSASKKDHDSHVKDKFRCRVNSYKKQGCIFIGKESDGILCRVPHNASLKDIKDILQKKKIRIGRQWRYFFLTWCKELHTKVKHEVVCDCEIVPQYRNRYLIYIEK